MANGTTIGVLALQGGFHEHLSLLRKAAPRLPSAPPLTFVEVRTPQHLSQCDALIIPGGESTTISLVATQSGLMEPLKEFVKWVPTLTLPSSVPLFAAASKPA